MQQGFAEGITVSLLACGCPLLPAQVLVFVLQERAEVGQPDPPGAARFLQRAERQHRVTAGDLLSPFTTYIANSQLLKFSTWHNFIILHT